MGFELPEAGIVKVKHAGGEIDVDVIKASTRLAGLAQSIGPEGGQADAGMEGYGDAVAAYLAELGVPGPIGHNQAYAFATFINQEAEKLRGKSATAT